MIAVATMVDDPQDRSGFIVTVPVADRTLTVRGRRCASMYADIVRELSAAAGAPGARLRTGFRYARPGALAAEVLIPDAP